MSEQGVNENGWEPDGYWRISFRHGNTTQVHVQRNQYGGLDPLCDDSGSALRFRYADGRRKIISYSALSNAEYIPHAYVPAG